MSSPADHPRHEVLDARRAELLHDRAQLDPKQLCHALHARLAEGAQAPDVRAADADRGRAHAQRLDDVGAAAEAGIHQDRNPALHRFEDRGWVTSYWRTTENNRIARYYQLSAAGRHALAEEIAAWHVYARAMNSVIDAE